MFKLSVNNENFLWMTRGKSWGFRYLSRCSSLSPVIDAVYKTVFLHADDEGRIGYWKGGLTVNGRKWLYVACRCYDSMIQRDEAGRRIPHEFLLICSNEEYNLLNGLAWESIILDHVRELYSERYPRCANEVTDCAIDFSVNIDSKIKPSNSCVLLDVSVPLANSPTNRKSISQKNVRAVLAIGGIVTFVLLCATSGSYSRWRGKGETAGAVNAVIRPDGGDALLGNGGTNIAPCKRAAETSDSTDGSGGGTSAPPSRLKPVKPALAVATIAPTRTATKTNEPATSASHNVEQNERDQPEVLTKQ